MLKISLHINPGTQGFLLCKARSFTGSVISTSSGQGSSRLAPGKGGPDEEGGLLGDP